MLRNSQNSSVEIIKDRLYWLSDSVPPKKGNNSFYFNIDYDLQYQSFYHDFGPLNLANTYKYISEVDKLLKEPKFKSSRIYHYTSQNFAKSANSAYLICAFQIVILNKTADQAFQPFKSIDFVPFRDASYGQCSYKCTILDCLRGLEYAIKLGWFQFKKFNLKEYQHYAKTQNGDINWIIPGKFVAFSSPYDQPTDNQGNKLMSPKDYVPIFNKLGVTSVVRLNNKTYESSGFTQREIKHHQLYFTDGTAPNLQIVNKFLDIAENSPGALAVHCKAGLGRTGSLIACYAMKHYKFNAADFIGWIRIVRPGSILGPQQHFLLQIQKIMKDSSKNSQIWSHLHTNILQKQTIQRFSNMNLKQSMMNDHDKLILQNGEKGQGDYLLKAKKKIQVK